MLVKLLGLIDLAAAGALLGMTFGMSIFLHYVLFCAGLLFIKGLFVLTGDFLSVIDIGASLLLIVSIWFVAPIAFYWIFTLLLLSKGVASFL